MTNALGVEIIFLTRDGDESILLQDWIESKLGNKYTRALNEVSKAISTYWFFYCCGYDWKRDVQRELSCNFKLESEYGILELSIYLTNDYMNCCGDEFIFFFK